MRRFLGFLILAAAALVSAGCRDQPEGSIRAVVIGSEPRLRDPARGPLRTSDAVLLQNVAQGLVRFDAAGNIVAGVAERWTVSDDGLSYIFRLSSAQWSDGRKVTARQVARALKQELKAPANPLHDTLGAVEDVVAMTDRVIEIRLLAPRPNLLPLLAQPALAILRNDAGTGPFHFTRTGGELRLTREIPIGDDERTRHEEVLLAGADAEKAVSDFADGGSDLVLGGTFADLPFVRRAKIPRSALRFDPASGLFGLIPMRREGDLARPEVRRLLSEAIDRSAIITALGVPDLTPRATLLEPRLDGIAAPVPPAWTSTPLVERLPALQEQVARLLGSNGDRVIKLAVPDGPGGEILFRQLARDWGALGFTVEKSASRAKSDFALVDEVAPSSSPAWFVRYFRCGAVPVCNSDTTELLESARNVAVPAQRYALLAQAAAMIDDAQLFIPITAPVRWSLVSTRIHGFAGNRYARHTLTDLERNASDE